jgi:hypothetical protein
MALKYGATMIYTETGITARHIIKGLTMTNMATGTVTGTGAETGIAAVIGAGAEIAMTTGIAGRNADIIINNNKEDA